MGLISVVTSLTPDMVEVAADGETIKVKIDGLAVYLAGDTRAEQLNNLELVACKLMNAHDAIAAQERLFDTEPS